MMRTRWRNIVIGILIPCHVLAQTPTQVPDVNFAKDMLTIRGLQDLGAHAKDRMPEITTPPANLEPLMSKSPTEGDSKGSDFIVWCNATPKTAMTDQQKNECQAALDVAKLDRDISLSGAAVNPPDQGWAIGLQKQGSAMSTSSAIQSRVAPPISTTGPNCRTETVIVPPSTREETCSESYELTPKTCDVPSNIAVKKTPGPDGKIKTTLVQTWNNAQCQPLDDHPRCDYGDEICADGPFCVEGEEGEGQVCVNCRTRKKGYTCYGTVIIKNDCGIIESAKCTYVEKRCGLPSPKINCADWSRVYKCEMDNGGLETRQVCTGTSTCIGAKCFDTAPKPGGDFAAAMAGMEAGRQAGAYMGLDDNKQFRIFKGIADECARPVGFMSAIAKNCCFESQGAMTDADLMNPREPGGGISNSILGSVAANTIGANVTSVGTHFAYDFMWNSDQTYFVEKAMQAIGTRSYLPSESWTDVLQGPSFSMYGFTLSTSVPTSLLPGTMNLGALTTGGEILTGAELTAAIEAGATSDIMAFLSFNPYLLIIMVLIMVYQYLQSCEENEKLMAIRRGQGLCIHLGTRCKTRMPPPERTCIYQAEKWCCWNSRLAKAIATQIASGETACNGFTPDEFAKIDFSKIDLTDFTNEIRTKTDSIIANLPAGKVLDALNTKIGDTATKIGEIGSSAEFQDDILKRARQNSDVLPPDPKPIGVPR